MPTIRIELPAHLQALARIRGELHLDVSDPPTLHATLDALEAAFPQLRGTIRDHSTGRRRDFLRFFACQEDLSHLPLDTSLPSAVLHAQEPLIILGAIAGG